MNAEMDCDHLRELAAEVALDIATGEERDAALRHVAGCPSCRGLVSELSSVGEQLLLLAPSHEPPAGLETRVLDAIGERSDRSTVTPLPRRRRWLTAVAVAAALALAAALGGGATLWTTADDRQLAESYRDVLGEGDGAFFAAAPLLGATGRIGAVFGYEGQPSWIVVTLEDPGIEGATYTVRIVTKDGRDVAIGNANLGGGNEVWGQAIPVDLSTLQEVRLVGPDGRTAFAATFAATNPWE